MNKNAGVFHYFFSSFSLLCFFFLLFLIACGGCKSSKKQQQQGEQEKKVKQEKKKGLAGVERVEIPLGDEAGEGEASLRRNFYFIFDGSGSMDEAPSGYCKGDQKFTKKIDGAKWALQEFMQKVPDDVNIGLYVFDYTYGNREVVPLGIDNRNEFLQAVQNIRPGGGTPLSQAIRFGTDQLIIRYKNQLGYGEYRLIVITDGLAERIPDAAVYAAKFGIPIYAIGLCIGDNHPLRLYAYSYRAADSFDDLAKSLEETIAESEMFDPTEFK